MYERTCINCGYMFTLPDPDDGTFTGCKCDLMLPNVEAIPSRIAMLEQAIEELKEIYKRKSAEQKPRQ